VSFGLNSALFKKNIAPGEANARQVIRLLQQFSVLHQDKCELDLKLVQIGIRRDTAEMRILNPRLGHTAFGGLDLESLAELLGMDEAGEDMDDPDLALAKLLSMEGKYGEDFLPSVPFTGTSGKSASSNFSPVDMPGGSVPSSQQPQVPV
jgi:hypothetical protein